MKKMMNQTGIEIKNILRHKFILIIAIIALAGAIIAPVLDVLLKNSRNNNGIPIDGPIVYDKREATGFYYGGKDAGQESITVDGITITPENPFYWQIKQAEDQKNGYKAMQGQFANPETLNLLLDMVDTETAFYIRCAKSISRFGDYRADFAWSGMMKIYDKFIYEHAESKESALLEMQNYGKGFVDPDTLLKKYLRITPVERLAALDKTNAYLDKFYRVIENSDFPLYIELSLQQQNDQIADLNAQIAVHEKSITDNPAMEENLSQIIESLKNQIKAIQTVTIPILQYRLEKNIIPGDGSWQNIAIDDISNSKNELLYYVIVEEKEFINNQDLIRQYKTYQLYKNYMQAKINDLNSAIMIAQKSLDAGQPDMKYVYNGARSKTVDFLDYSVFIAVFAVVAGGWIMASEFQQGTIRLLMIRPRTRIKILMSKFMAALSICLIIYIAGSLLNLITNGIIYGFTDFAYPNYNVSGEINFFAYYIPKLFACMIPILFAFSFAFMLSVLSRNIAVSIAVPIACFVLCMIAMYILPNRGMMEWLAYTPLPYVQISSFFIRYTPIRQLLERGFPATLPYGVILMLCLSAVWVAIAAAVFKKRDITN